MKNNLKKSALSWLLVFSLILPLLSSVIYTQAADGDLVDYEALSMKEIFASEESLTWVIAGDSITHNANWTAGVNSYGEWFEQYLYEINRGDDAVVLSGWGGAQTRDFLATSPSGEGTNEDPGMGVENFITKYNPDVITIKLGMNDRYISTDTFRQHYEQMLTDIYSICADEYGKKPKIILLSPTPLQSENIYDDTYHLENSDSIEESTLRIRNEIKDIAEEKGLLFCDLRTAFLDAQIELGEDYAHTFFADPSDGLHPNEAGQYCIFKALMESLEVEYDKTLPIFQYEYEDLIYHALYADSTANVSYSEMDNTMPTLSDASPIASVEFDNVSGILGISGPGGFNINTKTSAIEPLTITDVKSMEKEFTVVYRAKMETPNQGNAPILAFSSDDLDNYTWNNAFTLGTHGNKNQLYYQVRKTTDGTTTKYVSSGEAFSIGSSTVAGDDNWHTVAIVQRASVLEYYVDGVCVGSYDTYLKSSISEIFADATKIYAKIGSYGTSHTEYNLKGSFDYWQLYSTALSSDQIAELAQSNVETKVERDTVTWSDAFAQDSVWAVLGGAQMAGYETNAVNRSLLRYIENAMRGASGRNSYRDIRMFNMASPEYDVAAMTANYDTIVGDRQYNVFMLYPELSDVYESDYANKTNEEHLAAVAVYKENVETLLSNNSDKVKILWTPLASNNATINGYIDAYAEAVREIAKADSSILLFDANQFMNENMTANSSLANNWFENGVYISPLCAVDVARAFYSEMGQNYTGRAELSNHNLRYTSDKKVFKGNYVNDSIAAAVSVNEDTDEISIDVTAIKDAYANVELNLVMLPYKAAGNYNEDIIDLDTVATVAVSENVYTFKAPCADLNLAIYGEDKATGVIYRYKDISLTVATDATMPEISAEPLTEETVCLDSLEVMSAPAIGFDKDTTDYNVELYSYQTYARVKATAKAGVTITVNDEVIASGAMSNIIKADNGSKITVTASGDVSGTTVTKTYTLNLVKEEYPDIIITEVMTDAYWQSGANDGYELVEIYNASGKDLNLLDYSIGYKKDYTYNAITTANGGEYPYYFTGNDQAFSGNATHTGIKELTKYSMYWGDECVEPDEVAFPADSTMVIWIKFSPQSTATARETYGAKLTYETLISKLKENVGTYTLTTDIDGTETAVVPAESQMVVAEYYKDAATANVQNRTTYLPTNRNWYMDAIGTDNGSRNIVTRGWLFILKDGEATEDDTDGVMPTVPENGTITGEGNNIISAAKYIRPGITYNLSSVFSYNTTRGMSLVLNEGEINYDLFNASENITGAVTSDIMGYGNLTSFGAIEYWQKPTDCDDTGYPTIINNTLAEVASGSDATISLGLADETDVRYLELYVRKTGEDAFTKVTKDFVLEAGVRSAGVSADVTSTAYSYVVEEVTGTVEYYATVVDGNNHVTTLGTKAEPCTINLFAKAVETYSVTDAAEYVGKKAPECTQEGYLFAGWYADKTCVETPLESLDGVSGDVYALFVTEGVLSVKAQISDYLKNDNTTDDASASIRFVTTVDTLNYLRVGFDVSYDKDGDGTSTTYTRDSQYVYTRLYYVDDTSGNVMKYYPSEFSSVSTYFKACTVTSVPQTHYGMDFTVTPFWYTVDNVRVDGVTAIKSINDGIYEDYEAKMDGEYYATLEEAVAVANAEDAPESSTIIVLNNAEVESQLSITKNITIQSETREDITIYRGAGLAETDMFSVASGATLTIQDAEEKGVFVFDGRTVAEAEAGTSRDAAVGSTGSLINNSGTVKLINVTAQYVKKTGNDGAIVYNNADATVKVEDSVFDNNYTLRHAAAIYGKGTIEVVNSVFTNNKADNNAGVLCINGGDSMKVDSCTFINNAGIDGAAIWSNKPATITNSTFTSNIASGDGGAIKNTGSNTSITNCIFDNNTANVSDGATTNAGGGAIYNGGSNFKLDNCTFTRNYSATIGGAITTYASNPTISDSTFGGTSTTDDPYALGNKAGLYGGALYGGGGHTVTVKIEDDSSMAIFEGNKAEGGYGGAIGLGTGRLVVDGYTFTDNYAKGAGGAIRINGGDATTDTTVTNCVFTSNTTDNYGGAISTGKSMTVDNSSFTENKAASQRGGAIHSQSGATLTLKATAGTDKAIVKKNTAAVGGAICIGTGTLNVTGYTFDGNYTTNAIGGGAIVLNNNKAITANLTECVFKNNKGQKGGAILAEYSGAEGPVVVTITDCSFESNKANDDPDFTNKGGGAIYAYKGVTINLVANDSSKAYFTGNTSNYAGGAIYFLGTLNGSGYTFGETDDIATDEGTNNYQ